MRHPLHAAVTVRGPVLPDPAGHRAVPPPILAAAPGLSRWKEPGMNFMLIMKNEQSGLVAIGPLAVEYQAAILRDEIENSSNWSSLGIARVLSETQARQLSAAGPDGQA